MINWHVMPCTQKPLLKKCCRHLRHRTQQPSARMVQTTDQVRSYKEIIEYVQNLPGFLRMYNQSAQKVEGLSLILPWSMYSFSYEILERCSRSETCEKRTKSPYFSGFGDHGIIILTIWLENP